ncbi:uncharacterized protein LOC142162949 [Nicotiana tabacum]|uniref:Uncharacterized protein LOC142162949 n=1 Tax=Nicotiana tabacum TaxID=4097 RepID=A0AC58RU81_TOBAC
MEFVRLSKYAPQLVSTMDAQVRRFVQGLSPLVVNEAATVALHSDMNYGKIVGFVQATEARKLKIQAERESSSRARSGSLRETSSEERAIRAVPVLCPVLSKRTAICAQLSEGQSFEIRCRVRGHIQRDCRAPSQGMGGGFSQSSSSSVATSSVRPPALVGRGVVRDGARGRGVSSRFYSLSVCQSAEASPDVVTGILSVQAIDCYALIYLGSSLSYVTPFIASSFGVEPEQLHEPFSVSTLVGNSITAMRVYRNCVVMNGASEVEGLKGTAEGFIRKGVHTAKCVTVGCPGSFCQKKGWVAPDVY